MVKTWIKIVIYAAIAVTISTLSVTTELQRRHLKDARKQVEVQNTVIDSLLRLDRTYFEVQLYVTDKSVSKVYGSHNKGSITMPSERTYKLVVDSTNVKMK